MASTRWLWAALLAVVLVTAGKKKVEYEVEDDVIVLTDANFDDVIGDREYILVELYAPWCGHCQRLAPEYAKAARLLAKEDSPIRLAKIDGTANPEVNDKYIARGYPTLKLFKGDEVIEYSGKREAASIVQWLKKQTGISAKVLKSFDEVKKFKSKSEVVVIGHYKNEKDAAEFLKVVKDIKEIPVGITYDKDLAEKLLKLREPGVILSKASDETQITYEGKIPGLVHWIEENKQPLVAEFTQQEASSIFGSSEQKEFVVLFYKGDDKDLKKQKEEFKKAAKQFKTNVQFVQVDLLVESNDRIADFFGINPEDIPAVRAMSKKSGIKKFKPKNTKISSEVISKFTEQFKGGKLEAYLKSEEIPEDWDKGLVTVLVGKNFDSVARDPKKHVLVEFHAPWCPHCQNLIPAWDRLAELYAHNDDVVIAKMDATLNEVDGITIRALPTISLFPKDNKPNVDYTGELELKDIGEFLIKETGEKPNGELELPEKEEEAKFTEADAEQDAEETARNEKREL